MLLRRVCSRRWARACYTTHEPLVEVSCKEEAIGQLWSFHSAFYFQPPPSALDKMDCTRLSMAKILELWSFLPLASKTVRVFVRATLEVDSRLLSLFSFSPLSIYLPLSLLWDSKPDIRLTDLPQLSSLYYLSSYQCVAIDHEEHRRANSRQD